MDTLYIHKGMYESEGSLNLCWVKKKARERGDMVEKYCRIKGLENPIGTKNG